MDTARPAREEGVHEARRCSLIVEPWRSAVGIPALAEGDIHVWRVHVPSLAERAAEFEANLIPEERQRASLFRMAPDRMRHIVSQGMIRRLLARYLGTAPEAVPLVYGAHGKPALAEEARPPDLRFNASHAHEMVVIALTAGRELGVDVEYIRPQRVNDRLVRRFFSPGEASDWFGLPSEQRVEAFFRCWTRKEAYIKAKGAGLSLPLDRFTVSLAHDEPPALLDVEWDEHEVARWSLADIAPRDGYVGALAVEGAPRRVCCWDLADE